MEGLLRQVDGYCERTDFSYWSEPVNALTNLAFILAAIVMWRRIGPQASGFERALCAILFAIGVGSYLFHTHARVWAALADVFPIVLFILTMLWATHCTICTFSRPVGFGLSLLFFPYAAALGAVLAQVPFLDISGAYWTVAILILAYAAALARRVPQTARGLAIGGAILCLSITLRSVDEIWCDSLPLGTHFLWHILNAVMLGWMIEVLRRHRLARAGALA